MVIVRTVWAETCPSGCTCSRAARSVSCTGLSTFPDLSKTTFSQLDIQNSNFVEVPTNALQANTDRISVVISNSNISTIRTCAFSKLGITSFKIYDSVIGTIEPRAFSNITFWSDTGTFELYNVTVKTIDVYAFMYLFSTDKFTFSITHAQINKIKPAAFFFMNIGTFTLKSSSIQHIKTTAFLQFEMKTIDISDTFVKRLDCGAFFRGKGDYSVNLNVTCDCDIAWMVADKLVSAFNQTKCQGPDNLAGSYLADLPVTTVCPSGFYTSGCAIREHTLPQDCPVVVKPSPGPHTVKPPIIG